MTTTKTKKKTKRNQQNNLLKMRVASGDYSGMYYYAVVDSMSTTKDEPATRPLVVVKSDPELGHLVVPLSTKPLVEVHHAHVILPNSEKLSWLAPNEAAWVKQLNLAQLKHLPQQHWVTVQLSLKAITKACKVDNTTNNSLKDWLTKANQMATN